ncbi:CtsR family transcriptional regulator [Anaerovibrio sp.]|uniref:CtsR family transcriptional regulator n=1 Tax=Anaerovibrio sp. TaxID=1872532 RepID=UPI001B61F95A|nr:CtsR family transcriptional regulator [Anaerovibrio sp.]MBP3230873.1 CtsR family transcriptional regulator [Anaerovibrio sp.]MBR2142254.1 CtsR family transcriptional regulator [Anaerovibrio sp.]
MSNIADLIEEYILRRLAEQQTGQVELRRTDIADEISCAPSQISYVLNTRFTHDKGFTVESRRGLGGFIRIVRVPLQNIIYEEMVDKIDTDTDFEEIKAMVRYLIQHQLISSREGGLVIQAANCAFNGMKEADRVKMLKALFITLAEFS